MIEDIVKALRKVVKDQKDLDLIREVHEERPPESGSDQPLEPNQKNNTYKFSKSYLKMNEYDPDLDIIRKLADTVQQKKDEDLIREIHEENDVNVRQILPKQNVPRRILYKSEKTEVV